MRTEREPAIKHEQTIDVLGVPVAIQARRHESVMSLMSGDPEAREWEVSMTFSPQGEGSVGLSTTTTKPLAAPDTDGPGPAATVVAALRSIANDAMDASTCRAVALAALADANLT